MKQREYNYDKKKIFTKEPNEECNSVQIKKIVLIKSELNYLKLFDYVWIMKIKLKYLISFLIVHKLSSILD